MPYEYIRHQVDVRLTSKAVEVFYHNHRIASHVRVRNQEGQVITVLDHMPEKHQKYLLLSGGSKLNYLSVNQEIGRIKG